MSRGGLSIDDLPPNMRAEARAKLAKLQPPTARPRRRVPARVIPAVGWLEPITIIAPLPANVTNIDSGGGHWRAKAAALKAYHARCDLLPIAAPPVPVVYATLAATLYVGHAMDDDNALARTKPLTDWLVRRGFLVDDRRKFVRWPAPPAQVVSRKHAYELHLTITPVEAHR